MTTPVPITLGPDQARTRLRELTVIDVRTPGEYASGHLPGALNIPLDQIRRALPKTGHAAERGGVLVVVDRWFPSSKLCGACGAVRERLPPHVREWTCACGATHDRDVNAARTILAAGPAVSACGDGVRPQRESSRTGRSSVKQETQRATAGIPRLQAGEEVTCGPRGG
jgi:rhodanese-related sulfurtransferase